MLFLCLACRSSRVFPHKVHLTLVVAAKNTDDRDLYYMVFPYMNSDLAGLTDHPGVMMASLDIKILMKQLMEGVKYLHEVGVLDINSTF